MVVRRRDSDHGRTDSDVYLICMNESLKCSGWLFRPRGHVAAEIP